MGLYPRIVIAGIRGGSGKTTVSLGLIAALRARKGLRVIPFKKGPDYIDAGWMSVAAKNPCYNLDPFLFSEKKIMNSFLSHFTGDIALIEGNRGLHDGVDTEGSYSTAELAKLLRAPVVLVVDCTKMTRTTAAVVLGCMTMDTGLSIKGVVLNQVSGTRHESVIRSSIEHYCHLPVLGAVPRLSSGEFPERHMGLTPHQEHPDTSQAISFAQGIAEKYLDLDGIIKIAADAESLDREVEGILPRERRKDLRIGIIRDSAFQFYYPENFEELAARGVDLVEISALTDGQLPDVDALYIGGGFPETHAIALAENVRFRDSLKTAIAKDLPVYAECGGLMYLGEGLLLEGRMYPMAGVFPLVFSLEKRPQAHGYSIAEVVDNNPFYPEGTLLRGHEFHYSRPARASGNPEGITYSFKMKRGQGIEEKKDGICFKNVLATYTHVHALGAWEWVEGMIRQAKAFREKRRP